MAFKRGGGVGAAMYYAKAQYAFETLGAKEWWSTFESFNGWKRYGLGCAQGARELTGKVRKLGIPTIRNRVVSQSLLNILQPFYVENFYPSSYGYRPGKSSHW